MKTLGSAAILALLAISATSFATMIDFDSAPTGAISDFYKSEGVLFSTVQYDSAANTITNVAPFAGVKEDTGLAVSDPKVLFAVPSDAEMAASQNAILLTFVLPGKDVPAVTDAVSISLDAVADQDPRDDMVELFALGTDGRILAVDAAYDTETAMLSITRSSADIAKAVILFRPAPRSTDVEYYDNLSFTPPVPEPMTLSLLAFSGLGLLARKRA